MAKDPKVVWRKAPVAGLDLGGWNVLAVGGTGGLGRALSRALASRGAAVTVVGQTFRDEGVSGLSFVRADLSLLREADRVARALPAPSYDAVLFTTGIIAATARQETAEGIERDMAVSYLSRLVMLRALAPRLGADRPGRRLRPRVFVMGYPGNGQAGVPGDLNAEASYGAMRVHMNTVAGNEMLALDAARRYPHIATFGLNPGLIRTSIRDNLLGAGSLRSRVTEALIGWFTPSPETYADRIAPLIVSPDIDAHSGAMFGPKGDAILPTPALLDRAWTDRFLRESEALVARAGVDPASWAA